MKIGSKELYPRALFASLFLGVGAGSVLYAVTSANENEAMRFNRQLDECIGIASDAVGYTACVQSMPEFSFDGDSHDIKVVGETITLQQFTTRESRIELLEDQRKEITIDEFTMVSQAIIAGGMVSGVTYAAGAAVIGLRRRSEAQNREAAAY